jgi:hypothetical protein
MLTNITVDTPTYLFIKDQLLGCFSRLQEILTATDPVMTTEVALGLSLEEIRLFSDYTHSMLIELNRLLEESATSNKDEGAV